jgi:hypothetical protein
MGVVLVLTRSIQEQPYEIYCLAFISFYNINGNGCDATGAAAMVLLCVRSVQCCEHVRAFDCPSDAVQA